MGVAECRSYLILLNESSWLTGQGIVPLPKSGTPQRIQDNAHVFDFELSDDEVNMLHTGEYSPTDWDPTLDYD